MLPGTLGELQRELRTLEADGQGTDVRLVLLEAANVVASLEQLDGWLGQHAGDGMIHERRALHGALRENSTGMNHLEREWGELDLQEVTVQLRDIVELVDLLLHGARS